MSANNKLVITRQCNIGKYFSRFSYFVFLSFAKRHVRSSHRRCSIKKGVLKNVTKFTGQHRCQSLFFINPYVQNATYNERLMKLKLLRETLLLSIFLQQKVRKNQKMTKRPSLETVCRFLTCLLTLRPRMPHICGFLGCFSFSHFLVTSCRFQISRLKS